MESQIEFSERINALLTNTKHLKGFVIRSKDGELGTVEQFYFDDETWAIRYLVVDTGGWLGGKQVLVRQVNLGDKGIYYRAMVGPFGTSEEASQFCGSLKTAGGQCVVQRN